MIPKHRHYTRFVLAPAQREVIDTVAAELRPAWRHSFWLRCSKISQLSHNTSTGHVTDQLVERAVARALNEVEAMADHAHS